MTQLVFKDSLLGTSVHSDVGHVYILVRVTQNIFFLNLVEQENIKESNIMFVT